ncbi:transcriptional regulator [Kosakonia radicincitans]|uniref:LysR substrate-binding domain-containing protein n=1 Tax=Kosakonia radicincitans TaxID=283686 RepID=UPI0009095246|nr:LysR substrate-binding domain-containing protein [Kosakonia radicincitans]APG16067.1 transcriptional regulator [Kosakonia radicincitans]
MMRDHLPSLNALRAFESVARHLSMARAGQELHVTPGAISLHIRELERQLGLALFLRKGRGLVLTAAGESYYSSINSAFSLMREATKSLVQEMQGNTITLACTTGFATHWLLPRLPDFERDCPEIDLRISATSRIQSFITEGIDMAVRHGDGRCEDAVSEKLIDDDYIVVCTPTVARLLGEPPALSALSRVTLLHDMHREDWGRWLAEAGVSHVDPRKGPLYTDGSGAWLAMLAGRGMALIRRGFVQENILSGEVVSPFMNTLNTGQAYWLIYPPEALMRPAIVKVRTWLMQQSAKQTIAGAHR